MRQLGNWITDYVKIRDQLSESPVEFNLWSAISAVSAVLKNNVWCDGGDYKMYPNQYIVLVSPAGTGKGTAMHAAHRFVKDPPTKVPLANYITDKVTGAKLVDLITTGWTQVHANNGNITHSKDSSCILQASELRSLLHTNGDFMTELLCDTWDRTDYMYSTKNKGSYMIKDMCVSLTGACTPALIKDINRNGGNAIHGGLTARTIFIYAPKKSKSLPFRQSWDSTPALKCFKQKLDDDLRDISRLTGEIKFDPAARAIYEQKYYEIDASITEMDSEVVRNFKVRQASHIIKLAMTISAASSNNLIINPFAINTAIVLIDGVLKTLSDCFAGVGDSPLAEPMSKVEKFIKNNGTVSLSDLIGRFRNDVNYMELDTILSMLKTCNIVKEVSISGYRSFQYIGKP